MEHHRLRIPFINEFYVATGQIKNYNKVDKDLINLALASKVELMATDSATAGFRTVLKAHEESLNEPRAITKDVARFEEIHSSEWIEQRAVMQQ